MARPTYKDKTYLYVLPEHVPGTQVRCPVYARVTAIAGPRGQKMLKCQTIATDIAPTVEFEVPKNDCKLQIVTAREATTAPLRLWLRQFVFLAHEGRAFTGQVQAVDVEDEMFTVVPAETVESISPVSAILLWEFDVPLSPPEEIKKLMKRARRTHARIEKRITDPAEGSRDLAVILAKIIPDGEEVPATIDLVSPATGKNTRVSVQHVVDHLFYSVDGREVPKNGSVGDQYWEDPRFGDRDDDELDASSDSEVEESDDDDSVLVRRSAKSGPSKVKLVNKPKEPLKRPRSTS
ncbi:hypothetical protein SPRG_17346 [Saprolegnia parasitica CBS 223.65]|uniref:Uncharacterized protein n=1 Tax=Saprolegnia parasitica (strain CBS 223.65) TaxID=695850 RepID=A0A067BGI6_SAPPC|nr:hypothetical protein SPRG_17346 [Saprolegnia parasitica CBS 223.65]KDO17233.1 hypothetical protein SPRG_17346 [Saprolegnia parasitica CBS 223.65]|eukprot:XP_012212058.1 hypothetical protein SPRG_17346 [Saprolegnia parasitica CBS 223.65]